MRRYPFSFIALTVLGVASGAAGALALSGGGAWIHPVLNDTGAGIALLVTAVALVGSGFFPLVISRLIANDKREGAAPPSSRRDGI